MARRLARYGGGPNWPRYQNWEEQVTKALNSPFLFLSVVVGTPLSQHFASAIVAQSVL